METVELGLEWGRASLSGRSCSDVVSSYLDRDGGSWNRGIAYEEENAEEVAVDSLPIDRFRAPWG